MSKLRPVLTIKEIKERVVIEKRSAIDKKTNRVFFCPRDLGFDFTLEDCKVSYCSECWNKVKDYLELNAKSEEEY